MGFEDRASAGRVLAERLLSFAGGDALVLGLPRGGVPVAFEVAQAIAGELDVLVVRKLGAPHQPELAIGAIGPEGVRVVDRRIAASVGATDADVARIEARERAELERRLAKFRGARPFPRVAGRVVIVVDDGVATGSTARAALRAIRRLGPERLVFATPVGAAEALDALAEDADEVVAVSRPTDLRAIGYHYRDFTQVEDAEVVSILEAARERHAARTTSTLAWDALAT